MRGFIWWELYDLDVVDDGEDWADRWRLSVSQKHKRKKRKTPFSPRTASNRTQQID